MSMGVSGMKKPFALQLLSRILQPLQGLFNMLVYTRPHVKSYRSLHPDSSWFNGFFHVISKGGDDDQNAEERISRRSRRRSGFNDAGNRRSNASSALSSIPCGSVNSSFGSDTYRKNNMFSSRRTSMFGPVRKGSSYNDSHSKDCYISVKDPPGVASNLSDEKDDDTKRQESTVPVHPIVSSTISSTENLRRISKISWELKEARLPPSTGGNGEESQNDEENRIH